MLVAASFVAESLRTPAARSAATRLPDAVSARGETVASSCQACHNLSERQHRVGPHLINVLGRRAGSIEGFEYSPAMRASGLVWNRERLREFLIAPTAVVPGTAMAAGGWTAEMPMRSSPTWSACRDGAPQQHVLQALRHGCPAEKVATLCHAPPINACAALACGVCTRIAVTCPRSGIPGTSDVCP